MSHVLVRPQAYTGIASLVTQIVKHQKSARMVMFGLRNLSEKCSPGKSDYKENSLAALMENVVPVLTYCVETYSQNDDLILSVAKVLRGISEYIKENPDVEYIEKLKNDGGVHSGLIIFRSATARSDEECLLIAVYYLLNLRSLGIDFDCSDFIGDIFDVISPKNSLELNVCLLKLLNQELQREKNKSFLNNTLAPVKILKFLRKLDTNNSYANEALNQGLMVIEKFPTEQMRNTETISLLVEILDLFKSERSIYNRASSFLKSLMTIEEVQRSLKLLASDSVNYEERQEALTMLTAMSYVSTYADTIVSAGAIQLLSDAALASLNALNTNPLSEKSLQGLVGLCKILGKIAETPSNVDAVTKADGLGVIFKVSEMAKDRPLLTSVLMEALIPLLRKPDNVIRFIDLGGIELITKIVEKHFTDARLVEAGVEVLCRGFSLESIPPSLYEPRTVELLYRILSHHKQNLQIRKNVLSSLCCLVKFVNSFESVNDVFNVLVSLLRNEHDIGVECVLLALQFFNIIIASFSIPQNDREQIIDAVLNVILVYSDNVEVQHIGKSILRNVATEENMGRKLENLTKSLKQTINDPEKAFRALAAINGLAQISQLHSTFEKFDLNTTILSGLKRWIEGSPFPQQQRLIKAAMRCLESLQSVSSTSSFSLLMYLYEISLLPQMRSLSERQNINDTSLADVLMCCNSLCTPSMFYKDNNIGKAEISQLLELINKISWHYQDLKMVQLLWIAMLNKLAVRSEAVEALCETGTVKNVLHYMSKVVIYEDIQIVGLQLLLSCVEYSPSSLETIRASGGPAVFKAIRSSHHSSNVRRLLDQLSNLLTPSESNENEIKATIDQINHAIENKNLENAASLIQNLSILLAAPDSFRTVILGRLRPLFSINLDSYNNATAAQKADFASHVSILNKTICGSRSGLSFIKRNVSEKYMSDMLNYMVVSNTTKNEKVKEGIEANLFVTRCLAKMRGLNESAETSISLKRRIAQFRMLVQNYPQDKRIMEAASTNLSMIHVRNADDIQQLNEFSHILQSNMKSTDAKERLCAISAIHQLCCGMDPATFSQLDRDFISSFLNAFGSYDDDREEHILKIKVLNDISKLCDLREFILRNEGQDALEKHIKNCCQIFLNSYKTDQEVALQITSLLNALTRKTDNKLLEEMGILDLLSEAVEIYSNNAEMMKGLGDLMVKADSSTNLSDIIAKIISSAKNPSVNKTSLELLCRRFAVLVSSQTENIRDTADNLCIMCEVLQPFMQQHAGSLGLSAAISPVACSLNKSLKDSSFCSGEIARKINIQLSKTLVPAFIEYLSTEFGQANANKEFLVNAYTAIAELAADPDTYLIILNLTKEHDFISTSQKLLHDYQKDAEVLSAITLFLSRTAQNNDGYKAMTQQMNQQSSTRNLGMSLIGDTIMNLKKHSDCGRLAISAVPLAAIGFISQPELLSDKNLLNNFNEAALQTTEGVIALLDFYSKLGKQCHDGNLDQEIIKMNKNFLRIYIDPNTSAEQLILLMQAYTKMIKSLIKDENIKLLNKLDTVSSLNALLEENVGNRQIVEMVVSTLDELANIDLDYCTQIAKTCPLLSDNLLSTILGNEPTLIPNVLDLMTTLACKEGNGNIMSKRFDLNVLKTLVDAASSHFSLEEMKEIKTKLESLVFTINDDHPETQTLKQLYIKWSSQEAAEQLLNAYESALVTNNLLFLCETTLGYASKPIKDSKASEGDEFMYGCLCFSLLTQFPQNVPVCLERGEDEILHEAFEIQKNQDVIQYAVVACRDLCISTEGAANFSSLPRTKHILAQLITDAVQIYTPLTVDAADQFVIPRLQLVASCAVDTNYFNETQLMQSLIDVWDACDKVVYSDEAKGHMFRTMRRIINSHWREVLLKNDVTRRLVNEVNEKVIRVSLLVDVLYVIGALAMMQDFKALLAEHGSIEACLNLLSRCLNDSEKDTDSVQINACLALANITIAEGESIRRFIASKGVETSIKIMNLSVESPTPKYDLANAASVLMCNVSYRRDDIKKLYGDKQGPKAITLAIRKYDGSDSVSAVRCLSSMFKAIGNMALYIPNVKTFMEENLVQTFSHLYLNSEFVPDDLLLISLRTMSNLVMENEQQYMKEFGEVLLPILNMLTNSQRVDARMLCLAFDVLTNLCRLPSNYKIFVENSGLEVALRIANTHSDPQLCISATHLCIVQVTDEKSLDPILQAGFLTFLVNNLELQCSSEEKQTDICVNLLQGLTCILISPSVARQFKNILGCSTLIKLANASSDSPMVLLQTYRNLIIILNLFYDEENKADITRSSASDEWDADVADEGVRRSPSTDLSSGVSSAWQKAGMNFGMIRDLIGNICYTLSLPEYSKQLRLQTCSLGLLAYFAWARIPEVTPVFYAGTFTNVLRQALISFNSDPSISELACITIIHVCYISDVDDYVTVARNSQLIEAFEQAAPKSVIKFLKVKDMCMIVAKLLSDQKNLEPRKFQPFLSDSFDFSIADWKGNLYPHGVQGLPADIKAFLREGSRAKLVQEGQPRLPFYWRASQDLTSLQWHTSHEKNSPYNNEVHITFIRSISRGISTPVLQAAAAKDRKVSANVCLTLSGILPKSVSQRLELNLKLKSKKERDQMVHVFCEWRDAATHGF